MSTLATAPSQCALCGSLDCAMVETYGWDFEYGTTHTEIAIARCRNWAHMYLPSMPAPEAMSIIYPSNYYSFSETAHEKPFVATLRGFLEARKIQRMASYLSCKIESILDVGCGDGRLLDILSRNGFSNSRLEGLEISAEASDRARAKGYSVRTVDINDLDPAAYGQSYDLILCHQVIEHLRDPRKALRSLYALLRPGGVLSVETPDVGGWDAKLFRRRHWGGYHFPRHFHLFNGKALSYLLERQGFRVVHRKPLASPVFWILSLHNKLVDMGAPKKVSNFFHYQNVFLLSLATLIDIVQMTLAGTSSNMQILAQRPSNEG